MGSSHPNEARSEQLRDMHSRGLTVADMVRETGLRESTIRNYLSHLGLRANLSAAEQYRRRRRGRALMGRVGFNDPE